MRHRVAATGYQFRTKTQMKRKFPSTKRMTPELYRARLLRGIYSRVARKLDLKSNGRSHVSRVAAGERKSPRVEAALAQELATIERKVRQFERKRECAA